MTSGCRTIAVFDKKCCAGKIKIKRFVWFKIYFEANTVQYLNIYQCCKWGGFESCICYRNVFSLKFDFGFQIVWVLKKKNLCNQFLFLFLHILHAILFSWTYILHKVLHTDKYCGQFCTQLCIKWMYSHSLTVIEFFWGGNNLIQEQSFSFN